MKITKITMNKFRQYYRSSVSLEESNYNPIFVFVGDNGTGKTNIMNAFTWCLYGREEYLSDKDVGLPIVNVIEVNSARREDRPCKCSVAVSLMFENGVRAVVERTGSFKFSEDTGECLELSSELTVRLKLQTASGYDLVEDPQAWVERLFPRRIQPYFLFDGEKLENYFKKSDKRVIKSAVLEIAQIDLLDRLNDHLAKMREETVQAGRSLGLNGDLQRATARQMEAKADLEKTNAEIAEIEAKISELQVKVGGYEARQEEYAEGAKLAAERKVLREELNSLETHIANLDKELYHWVGETAGPVFARESLLGLRQLMESARAAGRMPPPVDPQFLRNLLDQAVCLCGAPLAEDTAGRQSIERLLTEHAAASELGNALQELEPGVIVDLDTTEQASAILSERLRILKEARGREDEVNRRLGFLEKRLLNHDEEKIASLQRDIQTAKDVILESTEALGGLRAQAADKTMIFEEADRELQRVMKRDERTQSLQKRLVFIDDCYKVSARVYEQLTDKTREVVSESFKKHFFKMIWKKDTYTDVSIDEDYMVLVQHKDGYEALGTLSNGERECLALSFSQALDEISGFELPIIIDMPLSRLDPGVKVRVASLIAEHMKKQQLIMLMLPDEYTEEVKSALGIRSISQFRLSFDEEAQATVIS